MADWKESTEETNGPQPPIIMKVDAPEESSDSSTNEDTEEQSNEENSRAPPSLCRNADKIHYDTGEQSNEENSEAPSSPCRKVAKIHCPVLAASKFGNSFGVSEFTSSAKPKTALLRPSALSSITATAPGPSAKAPQSPKFNNPFAKVPDDAIIDGNDATNNGEADKKDEAKTENTKNDNKTCEDTPPRFLPLGVTAKDNENSVNYAVASNSSTPSFVFGQNLKERVTVSSDPESSGSSEKEESKEETTSTTNENGSSELLFSNAATVCRSTTRSGLTLTQAAQEMEEANRANKRKYSQVTPLTGEEGETNVLQINCKLFAFDKATSSWQERGRGTLRLNDRDEESRIVGRASGTQRLVLNTKVWPGMTAERAGPKSLRLTAMDVQGDIKIFIVQAAPKEVDQLHSLLLQRLKRATERQPKKLATDH